MCEIFLNVWIKALENLRFMFLLCCALGVGDILQQFKLVSEEETLSSVKQDGKKQES